jgi:hypothetical protein
VYHRVGVMSCIFGLPYVGMYYYSTTGVRWNPFKN